MSKNAARKTSKRANRFSSANVKNNFEPIETEKIQERKAIEPLRALTKAQAVYLKTIANNTITFCTGFQGTGKTYIAGGYAAEQLKLGLIDKIYITRPGVECGRNWGALPGDLSEKYAPFMEPFFDVLHARLGKTFTQYLIKTGKIVAYPLEFMKGKTFDNCIAILDEAQNATDDQIVMFLTRIGDNAKMIIDGGITQSDIRNSGLKNAITKLSDVPSIGFVDFTIDDIVRNGIIKDILRAFAA